jgi:DNA-directed RNA polymerase subunit beta
MQSLALDVNVVSEEGQRAEMRDEDDDLLRAAEELGIDLSGVRAGDGEGTPPSDEAATEKDADEAEDEEEAEENGEAPDNLEDVDLDTDIDIGDIDIPEDDAETEEAEA